MIIKNVYFIISKENSFSSYKESINDGDSQLGMIYYFLWSDYDYFFTKTNQLDLTPILTLDNEVGFDSTTIGCMMKSKTVYIMNSQEIYEYFYENDLIPLELFEQKLISAALMPLDNFVELMNNWHQLNLQKTPFALLYQDEHDWISCKGFETEHEMDNFIKMHSDKNPQRHSS